MAHVRAQVAFGPRPSGSEALEKARIHIEDTLKAAGWDVERQTFDATPVPGEGAIKFVNIIGRFSATGDKPASAATQRIIVGSHYDTKRMYGITFVGANDAGSSTGAQLELARVLAKVPTLAAQVELVFFDGEEAVVGFGPAETGPDGLVGSRHYASSLRTNNRAKQFRCAVVWDMIGDSDLTITLPRDTPKELAAAFFQAGDALGTRKHLTFYSDAILDDHVPIQSIARIPAIDLIDFDYPVWHTGSDTLDKLSPESLKITGQLLLWFLSSETQK